MAWFVMFENFFCKDVTNDERSQPHSRRCLRALQPDSERDHRTAGKRGCGIRQVSEQRCGSHRESAIYQSPAYRGREVAAIGQLHGAAFDVFQMRRLAEKCRSKRSFALLLALMLTLGGCSHKPVSVAVPPAPPPKTSEATPPIESGQSQ